MTDILCTRCTMIHGECKPLAGQACTMKTPALYPIVHFGPALAPRKRTIVVEPTTPKPRWLKGNGIELDTGD